MRLPGTTLSNYMDSLDHTTLARVGQRTRAAKEQADILSDYTKDRSQLIEAGNDAMFDIGLDAANYAQGQKTQAGWFSTGADLIGMGVGVAGKMGAFGDKVTYPSRTSDGYPLGRGSDGSYAGFGGQHGDFKPPRLLPNGNYTFDR